MLMMQGPAGEPADLAYRYGGSTSGFHAESCMLPQHPQIIGSLGDLDPGEMACKCTYWIQLAYEGIQ
jgi:hypothetical protein